MPTYGWIIDSAVDSYATAQHNSTGGLAVELKEPPRPRIPCPVHNCPFEAFDHTAVQGHVFDVHRALDCFLRVGDSVHTEETVLAPQNATEARLVVIGGGRPAVTWTRCRPDGVAASAPVTPPITAGSGSSEANLDAILAGTGAGLVRVDLVWAGRPRTFRVLHRGAANLDPGSQARIEALVARPRHEALNLLQQEWMRSPSLERAYAGALFEYLLGDDMEAKGGHYVREASDHLQTAYQRAAYVATPLAGLVRASVCLRVGWYERLGQETTLLRMRAIASFFKAEQDGHSTSASAMQVPSAETVRLPLDPFHEHLIEGIEQHLQGNDSGTAVLIERMQGSPLLFGNRTNEVQLDLLEARHSVRVRDLKRCRALYSKLLDEPRFAAEASRYT